MLSGDYRVKKYPTGVKPYSEQYSSMETIEIVRLEVREEADTTASVSIFLALRNNDGSITNQDITYYLARSTPDDSWLIVDSNP